MSEELDNIDEKLSENERLKQRQNINRNKLLMDFNLVSSDNPAETNRVILRAIIIVAVLIAAYLVSFYI